MARARPPGRGLLAALAVALAVMGAGETAHAQIVFNPDGAAPANGDRTILALDWLPGNSVSIASIPITGPGQTFFNLYQAKLGATTGDSSPIAGLNTTFEITVVAKINEVVNSAFVSGPTSATALFTADADQSASFLEIYYDNFSSGVAADDLTGAGFTDGLKILEGKILPGGFADSQFTSNFSTDPAIRTLLDLAGVDNRGGQKTVKGSGSSVLSTSVTSYNPAFFKTPGITIVRTEFNTSLVDPFRQVNPSINFFLGDPRVYTPTLGAVNGLTGPDFEFQADSNQSFITQPVGVPEPGTIVLAVTGLATVSLGSLRKLRRRSGSPAA